MKKIISIMLFIGLLSPIMAMDPFSKALYIAKINKIKRGVKMEELIANMIDIYLYNVGDFSLITNSNYQQNFQTILDFDKKISNSTTSKQYFNINSESGKIGVAIVASQTNNTLSYRVLNMFNINDTNFISNNDEKELISFYFSTNYRSRPIKSAILPNGYTSITFNPSPKAFKMYNLWLLIQNSPIPKANIVFSNVLPDVSNNGKFWYCPDGTGGYDIYKHNGTKWELIGNSMTNLILHDPQDLKKIIIDPNCQALIK